MFGDEEGLGTPVEDMTSLAAVGQLRIAHRHVACIGFGIDAYHGVCHSHVLENVAALDRDGAYHGAFSLPRNTSEGAMYLKAVAHAERHHASHPSIVNGSIAAAIEGKFGDVQSRPTARSTGRNPRPRSPRGSAASIRGPARTRRCAASRSSCSAPP
jgi:hypothetical protein